MMTLLCVSMSIINSTNGPPIFFCEHVTRKLVLLGPLRRWVYGIASLKITTNDTDSQLETYLILNALHTSLITGVVGMQLKEISTTNLISFFPGEAWTFPSSSEWGRSVHIMIRRPNIFGKAVLLCKCLDHPVPQLLSELVGWWPGWSS